MASIGYNIKILREDREWSQEALAQKLDIDQATLSLYENDKRRPKIKTLRKLSLLFDVPVSAIDESLTGIIISDTNKGNIIQTNGYSNNIGMTNIGHVKEYNKTAPAIDEAAIRSDERKRMIAEVLESDLDDSCKVKLFQILNK